MYKLENKECYKFTYADEKGVVKPLTYFNLMLIALYHPKRGASPMDIHNRARLQKDMIEMEDKIKKGENIMEFENSDFEYLKKLIEECDWGGKWEQINWIAIDDFLAYIKNMEPEKKPGKDGNRQ